MNNLMLPSEFAKKLGFHKSYIHYIIKRILPNKGQEKLSGCHKAAYYLNEEEMKMIENYIFNENRRTTRKKEIAPDELLSTYEKTQSINETARIFNVSPRTIKKKLDNLKI